MCSMEDDRIARVGQAIEDLAAQSQAHPDAAGDHCAADRVADIWAMLAELDPELANRMAGYDTATE
jgi:hypothetical protein